MQSGMRMLDFVLHYCIIHAGIAITVTGGSDIMLFLRERKRNEEERKRNESERERSDQMIEFIKSALEQAAEERRQFAEHAAEERRQAEQRSAEERRQAAEERQAFLEALNRLADAITQNGRNR